MRQVKSGGQRRLLAQLVGGQYLGDRQDFGPISFEIDQRHRAIAGAEVNPETEVSRHGSWGPVDLSPSDRAGSANPSRGVHFTSTSAGAIAGSLSAVPRSNCGSFTI